MSSLWTPGGEIPVDRNRPSGDPTTAAEPSDAGASGPTADEEAQRREQIARMQQLMLEAPAGDIVAEHAMGLYELAVLHLSQPDPRLGDARLAIDAFAALVEGLQGRLGQAEASLAQALPQLKMAYVEVADRAGQGADRGPGDATDQG